MTAGKLQNSQLGRGHLLTYSVSTKYAPHLRSKVRYAGGDAEELFDGRRTVRQPSAQQHQ